MGREIAGTTPGLLPRAFFSRPAEQVAPDLLGCVLEHEGADGLVAVELTEVEAYEGQADPASHAYRGRTARNAVMFGPPGHAYVYFTYGMHFCVNLVCQPEGTASAVLLRAGTVVAGAGLAWARRYEAGNGSTKRGSAVKDGDRDLARGPARLCQALGISRAQDGTDVCDPASPLRVRPARLAAPATIRAGPRVGVSQGADTLWRFWRDGERTVSPYRPGKRLPAGAGQMAVCSRERHYRRAELAGADRAVHRYRRAAQGTGRRAGHVLLRV